MKTILKLAAVSAVALSAFGFIPWRDSAVDVPPPEPGGAYCLEYHGGGDDCSFKTYAQCEASASGTAAECEANVFGRDDSVI